MKCCRYLDFFKINNYTKLFKTINLFVPSMRFRYNSIKPIKNLSRRHFINSIHVSGLNCNIKNKSFLKIYIYLSGTKLIEITVLIKPEINQL